MQRNLIFCLATLLATSLVAADKTPKDEVLGAAKALDEKPNYAWKTVVVVPEDARWKPGPTEGKTEKDGFTHVTMTFMENKLQGVIKGDKGAALNQEGVWKSLEEMDQEEGPGRFLGMMVRNIKTPGKQASQLANFAKELKLEGDAYTSVLTEEGAKELLSFRPRGGTEGPKITDASGSVKFWIKEGALTKYEFKLKGTMSFNGNEVPNDRTTTVEVKDVGTTKLEVPEEAKKKAT